ncbi:sensor domain-containing diguanylate cyclase [Hydrogenothermus marinus]|uniref:diguanylate cyclase n=1 Tax=Hydrogenothermus marinus TaxID=133270 RepID=A0A3M0BIG5_9AQUI|nr:sensor domain-containing diguanylate cyclase [Hydrogenothermus marinus]RMA96164.1 diguanylate cyclase (GGDEF)-like protein [Hydrogenothermus marinus]
MKNLEKKVEKALEMVFNNYLNDDYMYAIFKTFLIKRVKKEIYNGFNFLIKGKRDDGKREFFKVGVFFYKENIPFSFFYDFIDRVRLVIIKDKLQSEFIDKLEDIFLFIENTFSYGYLFQLLKEDKDWIREELRLFKGEDNPSILKPYILDHLIWTNKLIEDIKKLRTQPSIELNSRKCSFGQKLSKGHLDLIIGKNYCLRIEKIHDLIHEISNEIYFYIQKRSFKNLLIDYINLIKNVGRLINTISLSTAVLAEFEAKVDPLTGVLNRRSMDIILQNHFTISKVANTSFSIAMIDIDDFKKINDTYGHLIGDCILKEVVNKIKNVIRKSDLIFRYGGEEFLILFPYLDKEDLPKVLEKIRDVVSSKEFVCEDIKLKITVSIGGATFEENIESVKQLIKKADENLYKAKKTGKNKFII